VCSSDLALPTNAIDNTPCKEHQNNLTIEKLNELPQIKLPEGQGKPVIV
jgi:hypothetical protein